MKEKQIAKKSGMLGQKSKMSAQKEILPKEHKHNVWKVIAIGVIVIFVLFMIGGIMKAHRFRSLIGRPTQEQIDYAKTLATEKLQSIGGNASEYEIHVAENMRKVPFDGATQSIVQVSFYSNKTTHTYIIDLDSKEVILHSQTDVYKEIGSPKPGCSKDDDKCNQGFNEDIKRDKDPEFRSPWFSRGFFGRR